MGLIDRLRRRFRLRKRWECTSCGKQYRGNPQECGNCGATVFRRVRDE